MPGYAVTSFAAFIIIFAMGLITLCSGRKERINVTFAIFCFTWSIIAVLMFRMQISLSSAEAQKIAHFIPAMVMFTGLAVVHYILALTGYYRDLDKKVILFRLKTFLRLYLAVISVTSLIVIFTGLIIDRVVFHPLTGYSLIVKPYTSLIMLPFAFLEVIAYLILLKGIRSADEKPYRNFIINNFIGLILIKIAAIVFVILLPRFGVYVSAMAFDIFALLGFYFFAIMMRYQRLQIEAMNVNLELKVEERSRDLTTAHTKLVHSEKMAALGGFIAGATHEINNPVGAAQSMHDTLMRGFRMIRKRLDEILPEGPDEDEVLKKAAGMIDKADKVINSSNTRIEEILSRMRSFAMLDQADIQTVDVHDGIEDTLNLLSTRFEENNILIVKGYSIIPKITCNLRQINQVFLNVFTNAVEAIEKDGIITVLTGIDENFNWIRISDTGCGIPEENLQKIFDPGFTTHTMGIGTGLGLAISYQIIQDHGGRIEVMSQPGEETTFTIYLPINGKKKTGDTLAN